MRLKLFIVCLSSSLDHYRDMLKSRRNRKVIVDSLPYLPGTLACSLTGLHGNFQPPADHLYKVNSTLHPVISQSHTILVKFQEHGYYGTLPNLA